MGKKEWVQEAEGFLVTFLKDFELTCDEADSVKLSEIEDWIKQTKLGINFGCKRVLQSAIPSAFQTAFEMLWIYCSCLKSGKICYCRDAIYLASNTFAKALLMPGEVFFVALKGEAPSKVPDTAERLQRTPPQSPPLWQCHT